MLKIRRPLGRLIFNMGIAIPGKTVFLIETGPWSLVIWITLANGQELLGFLCCQPEQTVEQTAKLLVRLHDAHMASLYISVQNGILWDIEQVHSGIC